MALRSGEIAYAPSYSASLGSYKLLELDKELLAHVEAGGRWGHIVVAIIGTFAKHHAASTVPVLSCLQYVSERTGGGRARPDDA